MELLTKIKQEKVVAIVRGLAPEHMLNLAEALNRGGICFMEVTFNQSRPETWKDTANAIKTISDRFIGKMDVGAGTVMTLEQLHIARDAGAKYIISPNVNESIIRETKRLELLSFPGAMTPTEIAFAHDCGADIVKVFPAGNLGPAYFKAVRAPLSNVSIMAVGGITEKNARSFIENGACGVGVGGNLVNREWIEAGAFEKITALAEEYEKAVK